MRCLSCQVILTNEEQKRKSTVTGDYLDFCNGCLSGIALDIPESISGDDPIWDQIGNEGDI